MKRIGPGLAALALAATAVAAPVRAADMAPAPGYYPPPAAYRPALYDWTGFYFGGHVGAGLVNDTVTQTTTTFASGGGVLLMAGTTTNLRPVGVLGGGQIGANVEFAPWLVGIEGSFTPSAITGNSTALSPTPLTSERATSNPQWLAAVTGRIGYAANTYLFYLKGGAAFMHAQYTQDTLTGSLETQTQSLNNTRSGFVAGGGLEYGMTENFSAKFEYDFYDFGTTNYNFTGIAGGMPVSIKSDVHVFTVGLNYRLNWNAASPVVARY